MAHALSRTLAVFRAAVAAAVVGGVLLSAAIATASMRFARCGPSRLDAADVDCRVGLQLLMAAYGVLGIALVLGAISLSLLWRTRRRLRAARGRRP